MNTFAVGDFKTRFSEILKDVQKGQEVVISYGKKKEKIAVIVPYFQYKGKKRSLGLLRKGTVKVAKDFKFTDQQFLDS